MNRLEFSCFADFFVGILKTREEFGFLKDSSLLLKLCPRIASQDSPGRKQETGQDRPQQPQMRARHDSHALQDRQACRLWGMSAMGMGMMTSKA
jgi:hypothetical protein